MTNPETQSAEAAEAQALQEALAGYQGKARAQAPAAEVQDVKDQPAALAEPAPSADEEDNDPSPPESEPAAPAQPEQPSAQDVVARQLEDLKAQVRELASHSPDAEAVRKMHGDIGNINRTLKKLKALEEAPAGDELAAALKKADEIAGEFPEIAGPLVNAIKALQSRLPSPPAEPDPEEESAAPAVDLEQERQKAQREAAIKALDEVHPDRHQIKETPEFKRWLAAKPPEYQKKVTTSWNPAVVAQPFTDFKAHLAAQQRRKDRLEGAVTPQGVPSTGTPPTISDEEAARRGYERARAKRL